MFLEPNQRIGDAQFLLQSLVPTLITKKREVVPSPDNDKRQLRKFTATQKARILAEAAACERGQRVGVSGVIGTGGLCSR